MVINELFDATSVMLSVGELHWHAILLAQICILAVFRYAACVVWKAYNSPFLLLNYRYCILPIFIYAPFWFLQLNTQVMEVG